MADDDQNTKGSAATWFLKKFFTSPATYVGLAVALAVGRASLGVDVPMGGAIGGGMMMGFGAGMISFLIMHGIKASHNKALKTEKDGTSNSNEQAVLESLRRAGQSDDADLLEKMFGDRDAILKRSKGQTENADAAHTLELASAIVTESCLQAEELQDLVRRLEDPLLTSPDQAERTIGEIRTGLQRAYQAVADARSRLRRGEKSKKVDFLEDSESLSSLNLSSLTNQLEEETAVSKRIEERLRPKFESGGGVVMDDPVDSGSGDVRESE